MPVRLRAARKAPPPPADLRTRLRLLRVRAEKGINRATGVGCVLALFPAAVMAIILSSLSLPVLTFGLSAPPVAVLWAQGIVTVLIVILAAWGVAALIRLGFRRLFERHYVRTWQELFRTSFMTLVTVEDYTQIISQRVQGQFGLRWLSPPMPKSLEHQLEYAAVYQLGLERMLRGVGRLDNGPLWQGGLGWTAGRYGCFCAFALVYFFSIVGLALVVVGMLYHVQGCAALAAYCDFLLYDDALAASQAAAPER